MGANPVWMLCALGVVGDSRIQCRVEMPLHIYGDAFIIREARLSTYRELFVLAAFGNDNRRCVPTMFK